MDAADLKIFEAVARLGSMNRAAAELNTVQSNVTAHIRQLEDELGVPLFERHSRGVTLTAAGQRLLPFSARVGQVLEDARRAVAEDGTPKGPLTIGALETTAAVRLSPLLGAYAAAHPAVDLVLSTGTTAELVEAVLERRLEGAFVCGPVHHPELDEEPIFSEELALLTALSVDTVHDLAALPDLKIVVLRAGCSYRQRLEAILAQRGIVGLRRLEFGTIEAILGCVKAGLGVTLLPESVVRAARHQDQVAIHRLPARDARVETVFIRRRDGFVSSALVAFLAHARPASGTSQAAE
ncbi:MAG: LysR substrate-binding domain-containing protein [Alphaproteobacteria bacterium]|nr:LysR substrate-binding domain-containing protein [Alphaproteobacteria bacterium]